MVKRKTKEDITKNMRAVKSSGSKIEKELGKAMWDLGLRYRKNVKEVFGKPDFVFKSKRIAVFCDSEFWHGKQWSIKKNDHKTNISFWHKKIESNIERDKTVNDYLIRNGWVVIRFWGEEILSNSEGCANIVRRKFNELNE